MLRILLMFETGEKLLTPLPFYMMGCDYLCLFLKTPSPHFDGYWAFYTLIWFVLLIISSGFNDCSWLLFGLGLPMRFFLGHIYLQGLNVLFHVLERFFFSHFIFLYLFDWDIVLHFKLVSTINNHNENR